TVTGPVPQTVLRLAMPDGEMSCPYLQFDLEGAFPVASESIDLAIFTEVLEHLTLDPMRTLGELNRIIKPGGYLLLSTRNCTSLRSVVNASRGKHPYQWAPYSKEGHTDRHNREYTPSEVRSALEAAGFRVERLLTSNEAYGARRNAPARLAIWLLERA